MCIELEDIVCLYDKIANPILSGTNEFEDQVDVYITNGHRLTVINSKEMKASISIYDIRGVVVLDILQASNGA